MQPRDTVVGVFDDPKDAQDAISALKDAGFASDDIGVVARPRHADGVLVDDADAEGYEATTTGILAGGFLGGVVGWLAGAAIFAAPGLGALFAAGALAAAVSGAGVGAAAGGLIGALVDSGLPEEEARWYEERVRGGSVLITVKTRDRHEEARAILQRYAAQSYRAASG
jgi:hypothetical protein